MTDHKKQDPHELPELQRLQQELEAARQQAADHLAGWQRAQADYQNLKKESATERERAIQLGQAALVLELLPVVDNFQRAMEHLPAEHQKESWVVGIQGIHRQLHDLLDSLDVHTVATTGAFDPTLHEAVSREKREGVPSGTILSILEDGYLFHGELLRPAKVVVAE